MRLRHSRGRPLRKVTIDEVASEHLAEGSMGPKVAGARPFAQSIGNVAVIGALDGIAAVIGGKAGTRISATHERSEPAS